MIRSDLFSLKIAVFKKIARSKPTVKIFLPYRLYEISRNFIRNVSSYKTIVMKKNNWKGGAVLAAFVLLTGSAIAWQQGPAKTRSATLDTVPDRSRSVRNIDEALEEVERGRRELEKSIREVDLDKVQREVQEAMKDLKKDMDKMQRELKTSLAELNEEKIGAEIEKALKEVDRELRDENLSKVQAEKIRASVEAARARIDMKKAREEMQRLRDVDMKKVQEELGRIRPQIEASLKEARVSLDKAKKELEAVRDFINDLDRQGLIEKEKPYTIEYKKGELTVNGKKQPADVVQKFQYYLKEKKDFTIQKSADDFDIRQD